VVGDGIRVHPIDFGTTSDPGPLSPLDSPGFHAIATTVGEVFPGVTVAPWILLGATDSRYFVSIADGVYRFAPLTTSLGDLSRIHGTGERIAVADAGRVVTFYRRLVTRFGATS
jgi:carboxypeptidase PM20D1